MSKKDELTRLTNRCKDVVQQEADLMDAWAEELDALGLAGRAAQCRITSNRISTGSGSPLWRVEDTVQRVADCSENQVIRPPTAQQEGKVATGESDYSNREKLSPGSLSQASFSSNLIDAQGNASRTSSLAEVILNSCTAS